MAIGLCNYIFKISTLILYILCDSSSANWYELTKIHHRFALGRWANPYPCLITHPIPSSSRSKVQSTRLHPKDSSASPVECRLQDLELSLNPWHYKRAGSSDHFAVLVVSCSPSEKHKLFVIVYRIIIERHSLLYCSYCSKLTRVIVDMSNEDLGTALLSTWYVRKRSWLERPKLWTMPPVRSCNALVVELPGPQIFS